MDATPGDYVTEPRTVIEVPFVADPSGALGFVLDLHAGDRVLPFFTTSWDRMWAIPDLDLDRSIYRGNFGTYGFWPPSLPLADPVVSQGALRVKVFVAPAGPGVPGARVSLDPDGVQAIALANGIASFDPMLPGSRKVSVQAAGYVGPAEVTADLADRQHLWLAVPVHAVPGITADDARARKAECVSVRIDPALFAGQAAGFSARVLDAGTGQPVGPEADVPAHGDGDVCMDLPVPHGSLIEVTAVARYGDGTLGVPGASAPILLDRAPPAPEAIAVDVLPPACVDGAPRVADLSVTVDVIQSRLVIDKVEVRRDQGPWTTVEAFEDLRLLGEDRGWRIAFDLRESPDVRPVAVRVTNGAGLTLETAPVVIPPTTDRTPVRSSPSRRPSGRLRRRPTPRSATPLVRTPPPTGTRPTRFRPTRFRPTRTRPTQPRPTRTRTPGRMPTRPGPPVADARALEAMAQ